MLRPVVAVATVLVGVVALVVCDIVEGGVERFVPALGIMGRPLVGRTAIQPSDRLGKYAVVQGPPELPAQSLKLARCGLRRCRQDEWLRGLARGVRVGALQPLSELMPGIASGRRAIRRLRSLEPGLGGGPVGHSSSSSGSSPWASPLAKAWLCSARVREPKVLARLARWAPSAGLNDWSNAQFYARPPGGAGDGLKNRFITSFTTSLMSAGSHSRTACSSRTFRWSPRNDRKL